VEHQDLVAGAVDTAWSYALPAGRIVALSQNFLQQWLALQMTDWSV
jgi:hypothetical protein